ncbi:MAG: type I restriction endonuclease subunit R [Gomphosphaeria aponina SAG 52.96 = DSM 107014]|uniref:Type I restriction endonuclease subunit R n=1 Tax=Gomphosphaeria aponina SAG 52.96 = DSM 107014 TaxID=1521640 RepID=A0A941JV40_9CHRO|nr:type I restriction endonuclease subunit R [Gomphosphaeria aponina SAG 52.96 = DSM 107014]
MKNLDTSEKNFEQEIVKNLQKQGYELHQSQEYDRLFCLIPNNILKFIQTTQPKEWEKFSSQYQEAATKNLLKIIRENINKRGTLEVLRKGIQANSCRFKLAYFQPETSLNKENEQLYQANIFSIIRQLYYSEKNNNSLDLVLFLNGLPIFTAELKSILSGQKVDDSIKQYKNTREQTEQLFKFGVCLSHFAVDQKLVYMTTHLQGENTQFLPFNPGDNDAVKLDTAYLWEKIWQKTSILDLIQNFITEVEKKDEKGKKTGEKTLIFPRYHQLDTVRKLVEDAQKNGPGKSYLIQHSAGSGKSNSIAWLAHRLSSLHNIDNNRIFDSIVVITDRKILDKQLQNTISQFEQKIGVVEKIDKDSNQLKKALEEGKNIIVTTLQKFPIVVQKISKLRGRNFAVIIDEAHSSQTGESAKQIKSVLTTNNLEIAAEEESKITDDIEDIIVKEARKRGKIPNLSYFAFTATPKNTTLELFGTKNPDGSFTPFSLYSMRQAIEEGFILNVLENYTTYKTYFKLLKTIENDPKYDSRKVTAILRNFVEMHEQAIKQKVAIIVEHFHNNIAQEIKGKAKAMIVTSSRLHAVRYKLALDEYIQAKNYPYQTLVAFTGKVQDGKEFTETNMNTASTETANTFKQEKYRFLVVANKFQTGFDEPLLCAMYIDKKLKGVNAVQTLSRLNRIHPQKISTMVLDFVNEAAEIKAAFQMYYNTIQLNEATDPNLLYDLERKLAAYQFYNKYDIENVMKTVNQAELFAVLKPIEERIKAAPAEDKKEFSQILNEFIKLYGFVAQLLLIPDADLEKLYQFSRYLNSIITGSQEKFSLEILKHIELEKYKIDKSYQGKIELESGKEDFKISNSTEKNQDKKIEQLSEIIKEINRKFGTNFGENERVFMEQLETTLNGNQGLKAIFQVNSRDNARYSFNNEVNDLMEEMIEINVKFYNQFNSNNDFKTFLLDYLCQRFIKQESA